MFEKYRVHKNRAWYGINKRHHLFFYRPLRCMEITKYADGTKAKMTDTWLLFKSRESATIEANMLSKHKVGELIERAWQEGNVVMTHRARIK